MLNRLLILLIAIAFVGCGNQESDKFSASSIAKLETIVKITNYCSW